MDTKPTPMEDPNSAPIDGQEFVQGTKSSGQDMSADKYSSAMDPSAKNPFRQVSNDWPIWENVHEAVMGGDKRPIEQIISEAQKKMDDQNGDGDQEDDGDEDDLPPDDPEYTKEGKLPPTQNPDPGANPPDRTSDVTPTSKIAGSMRTVSPTDSGVRDAASKGATFSGPDPYSGNDIEQLMSDVMSGQATPEMKAMLQQLMQSQQMQMPKGR